MNLSKLKFIVTSILMVNTSCALANEVSIKVNKPATIEYRLVYRESASRYSPTCYWPVQAMEIQNSTTIPIPPNGCISTQDAEFSGIVIWSVDGKLIENNEFYEPDQCSMTTSAKASSGEITIDLNDNDTTCTPHGGVFN